VSNIGFEVPAVMKDKNAVLYNMTPFSVVHIYHTALQEVTSKEIGD
jgi:hypothetical protein